MSLVIIVIMWSNASNGKCDIFATRNFFLGGVILFQSVSGAQTLLTGDTEGGAAVNDYRTPGLLFCIILTIFVVLFLALYRKFGFVERLAERQTRIRVTTSSRLVLAGITLVLVGGVLRFAGARIPYVAILLPQLAAGVLGGGVTLVAMAWARSSFNLFIAAMLGVTLVGAAAVILVDAFGRRELVGILFSMVAGLYFEKWRWMPVTKLLPRAVIALSTLAAVVLIFSSSRTGGENVDRSLTQQLQRIREIDARSIQENIMAATSGQFAGGISMWVIDARRADAEYYPMHSLFYFATLPIPRNYWPGKPEGLGMTIVDQAGISGVSEGHSWGPGLVGHLYNDIVFFSLPVYALILAAVFRYMDTRTLRSIDDPVTIAIFGSALGQVFGMPRGDLGLFAFNMRAAYSGVWIFGRLVAKVFLPIDREAELLDKEQGLGSLDDEYDDCPAMTERSGSHEQHA